MTPEQKRQILELAEDEGITLNGYTADAYEYESRILIIQRGKEPSDWSEGNLMKHENMGDMLIVPFSYFERQLLTNKGKF